MSKFANVVTIEVAPGRRDQVVTSLLAHKTRVKAESGTLQFDVVLPREDDSRMLIYQVYQDDDAFEPHRNAPSRAQWLDDTAGMDVKVIATRCTPVE